jgi:hypothetical protein
MRKLLLLVVLLGGCATSRPKPVAPERVPEPPPWDAPRASVLSVADVRALARVYDDARELIWQIEAGHGVCDASGRVIGVTVWAPDASGMRYVAVFWNPDACPDIRPVAFIHRSLAYVLTPDGKLLGPRVRRD